MLHLLPPYCPHFDPIERLRALMHENVTHNWDYKTFHEFRREILQFLRLRPNHEQFPHDLSR